MASTSPPPAPAPQPPPHAAPRPQDEPREITIVSHSNLYYWWPVWAFGFLMAVITYFQGYVMAVFPAKDVSAAVHADVTIKTHTQSDKGEHINEATLTDQVVVYAPQKEDKAFAGVPVKENNEVEKPHLRVSPNQYVGVVFVFILLMTIFITNVPLRGMWSLLVIVVAVALVVIFLLLHWMETLLSYLYMLDVRINMAGYMTISVFLLIIWLVALLIFDKQRVHHGHAGPALGVRGDRRRPTVLQHQRHDAPEAAQRRVPPLHPRPGFGRSHHSHVRRPGPPNRLAKRAVHQRQGAADRKSSQDDERY